MPAANYASHAYRELRKRIIKEETHCCLCGLEVDKSLPYRDGNGKINVMSKTVHHKDPLNTGGELLKRERMGLAHWKCNMEFGDGTSRAARTSREW